MNPITAVFLLLVLCLGAALFFLIQSAVLTYKNRNATTSLRNDYRHANKTAHKA